MLKKTAKMLLSKYYNNRYTKLMNKGLPLDGKYLGLRLVAECMPESFVKIKRYNDKINIERIRKKKKIRFGFVVYTSSMWNVDELYKRLAGNERFDTSIIIAHFKMPDRESSDIEYDKTLKYFKEQNYRIVEANSLTKDDNFDILFYLTPFDFFETNINFRNISLNTIILHTSYSYMLSGNNQKLSLWMYHVSLRYYTDSEYYKRQIENSVYYTGNARYSGFPKIDRFYTANEFRPSNKKVIIYAPHHSVNYTKFKSATFGDNYLAILELAKRYSEDTFWIYKPHPLLRANSVLGGLFRNVEEYDEYEEQWKNLSNAEVITSGDYFPVFKGSDAMITDSVSFLAEYQFTGKPLLLLESGKEEYNDFGNEIVNILYKCDGKAISEIESFISDVINGRDEMQEIRKRFFEENLFYMADGTTANKRIYEDIIDITNSDEQGDISL